MAVRRRGVIALTLLTVALAGGVAAWVVRGNGEAGFDTVTDATGRLTVSVPAGWNDRAIEPLDEHPYIQAAPDLDAYRANRAAPGAEFLVVEGVESDDVDELLADVAQRTGAADACERQRRHAARFSGFRGEIVAWTECRGGGEVHLAGGSRPDGTVVVVGIQSPDDDLRRRLLDQVRVAEPEARSG